ncbi:Hypothetical protein SMAX5B_003463 [Scophthalmus maximus]|uniref:Uncharacterized protein n=1 Tax=Scophthalmus maximus TaxID=52904 RepID=A0A2U9CQ41_SCOMX|nr:Hypothetical protein SMAX5B_003463 [Scophthalmus maximus]
MTKAPQPIQQAIHCLSSRVPFPLPSVPLTGRHRFPSTTRINDGRVTGANGIIHIHMELSRPTEGPRGVRPPRALVHQRKRVSRLLLG